MYISTYNLKIFMEKTISEFDSIIKKCEDIFKKMKDYGSSLENT